MTASVLGLLSFLLLVGTTSLPQLVVPNSPDLMIKTKRTGSDSSTTIETLYLKGARQRRESSSARTVMGRTMQNDFIDIRHCDERVRFSLNPSAKTYVQFPIEDWSERMKRARPVDQGEFGADVSVTIDSVDTGERKRFGSYEARHVKTTTRVEPSPGASTPARIEEVDGWYIDLPGLGCEERPSGVGFLTSYFQAAGKPLRRDRIQIKRLGTAPRGFAVAEKTTKNEAGKSITGQLELIELSEAPLDTGLFTLPAGYSPALRTPSGGYDMLKPDTVANRTQQYWALLVRTVQGWFR
jgi:hypothetical protein